MELTNRVVYCSTAMYKGGEAAKTALTLNFANVTKDDLIEYAIDTLIIKWQNSIRRNKNIVTAPSKATYLVTKPGTRAGVQMTKLDMLYSLFGKEKVIALINKAGGDVDAVVAQFESMFPSEE